MKQYLPELKPRVVRCGGLLLLLASLAGGYRELAAQVFTPPLSVSEAAEAHFAAAQSAQKQRDYPRVRISTASHRLVMPRAMMAFILCGGQSR